MSQPWGSKVQERYMQILLDEDQDAFIFKFRDGSGYCALPRQTPLGMEIVMTAAEIVSYCSIRMKHINGASL
jgi:hypothetical protein